METSSNISAKWIHAIYNVNGVDIEGVQYIIPVDSIAYILTGTAKNGELSKYRNDFDNMAKSFRLGK